MAVHPFYNGYRIDDANIGCHRVIYADCDGIHKYKSVCELVKECVNDQLKNKCIVDFLNTDLSKSSGQYLKITNNGCLAPGTPECPCDDKYVAATRGDEDPGTLDEKLIGNCDPTGTYCIKVTTPTPNTVQVTPSGPMNGFIKFKGTPLCNDAIVKMNKNGEVYTECPDIKPGLRYLVGVHKGGRYTQKKNSTERIKTPARGTTGGSGLAGFSGGWNFMATDGFAVDDSDQTFLIQEDGLYWISFSLYTDWSSNSVHAIRAGIFVNGIELGDWKYEGGRFYQREDYDWYAPFNRTPEGNRHTQQRAIEFEGISFGNSVAVVIKGASKANPVGVSLQLKPDIRTLDPKFTYKDADDYPDVTYKIEGESWERGPPTTIYCYKMDDVPVLKELR